MKRYYAFISTLLVLLALTIVAAVVFGATGPKLTHEKAFTMRSADYSALKRGEPLKVVRVLFPHLPTPDHDGLVVIHSADLREVYSLKFDCAIIGNACGPEVLTAKTTYP